MASVGTQTRLNDKTFTIVRWLQDPVNSVVEGVGIESLAGRGTRRGGTVSCLFFETL